MDEGKRGLTTRHEGLYTLVHEKTSGLSIKTPSIWQQVNIDIFGCGSTIPVQFDLGPAHRRLAFVFAKASRSDFSYPRDAILTLTVSEDDDDEET